MLPLFLLGVNDMFKFYNGVGEWKIIKIESDEKVICTERITGKKAWFWTNRLVKPLNN